MIAPMDSAPTLIGARARWLPKVPGVVGLTTPSTPSLDVVTASVAGGSHPRSGAGETGLLFQCQTGLAASSRDKQLMTAALSVPAIFVRTDMWRLSARPSSSF